MLVFFLEFEHPNSVALWWVVSIIASTCNEDIMFFVDMVGDQNFCYKQAIAITAGQGAQIESVEC